MTVKTITRADIAEAIYRDLGFSHSESFKFIEQIIQHVITALANGEEVKIAKFATFTPHAKHQRIGRNPKTGETHPICSRTVVSFKASNSLKGILAD